jgi:hypothetical protein
VGSYRFHGVDETGKGRWSGFELRKRGRLVRGALENCRREHHGLLAEWEDLSATVCLLGMEIDGATAPKSIAGLQQQIATCREQCRNMVGEKGGALLAFFRGQGDCPSDMTLEALREALLALKPFISVGVGGRNA